jgi:hypothetical protein
MRGRRSGESLFHWGVAPSLWFGQFTHDVKLTNLRNSRHFKRNVTPGQPTPVVVNNSGLDSHRLPGAENQGI